MDLYLRSLDFQIIIWIPLALITLKELKKDWRKLWDNDLTVADRQSLQRLNIFFVMPLVVLLHELGHAFATIQLGGVVKELHFGIWWGYVIPVGNFTALDDLIITLAGSGVQILFGFLALIVATLVKSPPVVAMLVYSGLFSIAGTVVIYALMSVAGMYGDWISIYRSTETQWVMVVAVCHALLVGFVFYLLYGEAPKIWYTGKTRPKWKKDYQTAKAKVAEEPNAINNLSLAWAYYLVGLNKKCLMTLEKVKELDPDLVDRWFLVGCLERSAGNIDKAIESFEQIVMNEKADDLVKVRALLAEGHCLSDRADYEITDKNGDKQSAYASVLETYEQAAAMRPDLADPLFFKATILNKVDLHKDAEILLKQLDEHLWLDPTLKASVPFELKAARSSKEGDE